MVYFAAAKFTMPHRALPPRVETAVRTLLANPFGASPRARKDAEAVMLDGGLVALLAGVEQATALRAYLAAGHAQARRAPDQPGAVLRDTIADARLRASLRPQLLPVVMAAARCERRLESILGASPVLRRAKEETWAACFGEGLDEALLLQRLIRDHDVLLLGETGTGKELFALALQEGTPGGPDGEPAPSGAINAAAIPETLVESELFGHAKGAFTGATEARTGRIRAAHRGSFFLDEVGDLPSATQVKLLRVIEANEVSPLGSDSHHRVDVRYLAATHKPLEELVERGHFRQDLYQRLAGNLIRLPPLRERPEDIEAIGLQLVERYLPKDTSGDPARAKVQRWLRSAEAQRYPWPGNVRELQNALRNLLLGIDPVEDRRPPRGASTAVPAEILESTASDAAVGEWYLANVLAKCHGNQAHAARVLGLDRATVRRRAAALHLRASTRRG